MALFKKKNPNAIKPAASDRALQAFTTFMLVLLLIIVGYPVVYVVSCSFSDAKSLQAGRVFLWPLNPTLAGYKFVFKYKRIWIGYRNTVFYTVCGTLINMFMTTICAYPLSKPNFPGKKIYLKFFVVTMLFGAGLIPTYILRSSLGLVNNVWAMLTIGMMSIGDMVILRAAFSAVPRELYEAAEIDGANDFTCMMKIGVPLAKATLSVLILYYAVSHWNAYFNAMIYLRDQNLFPLQVILRTILMAGQMIDTNSLEGNSAMLQQVQDGTQQIKYALIVVSTVPVLILYFIVQKYFKKGVMVGSVKG